MEKVISACLLVVSGILTDEGLSCQTLRGDDGKLYTLQDLPTELVNGDRVSVNTGGETPPMLGVCDQGEHIHWVSVTRSADGARPEKTWERDK